MPALEEKVASPQTSTSGGGKRGGNKYTATAMLPPGRSGPYTNRSLFQKVEDIVRQAAYQVNQVTAKAQKLSDTYCRDDSVQIYNPLESEQPF